MIARAVGVLCVLFIVGAFLTGCQTMGTVTDPLAQMKGQVLAARQTCIDLLNRDRLTGDGGVKCLTITNQASSAIGVARLSGNPQDLESAKNALIALETYLKEQAK